MHLTQIICHVLMDHTISFHFKTFSNTLGECATFYSFEVWKMFHAIVHSPGWDCWSWWWMVMWPPWEIFSCNAYVTYREAIHSVISVPMTKMTSLQKGEVPEKQKLQRQENCWVDFHQHKEVSEANHATIFLKIANISPMRIIWVVNRSIASASGHININPRSLLEKHSFVLIFIFILIMVFFIIFFIVILFLLLLFFWFCFTLILLF